MKILHNLNSQELPNMLLAFVYVDAKNPILFQDTGKVISGMDLIFQDRISPIFSGPLRSRAKPTLSYFKLLEITLLVEV